MAAADAARLWNRRRELIGQRRDLLTDGSGHSMPEPATADAEAFARINMELEEIEAQLATLEAEKASGTQRQGSDPGELKRCKASILALTDADRQQLVLWIARGMPKGE